MPMREQSRIKADTVAEECTCEECPAPAPDIYTGPVLAGMRFERNGYVFFPDGRRGNHGEFLDAEGSAISEPNLRGMYRPIQSPAPAPSAPLAGVSVCATGVHVPAGRRKRCHCGTTVCDCDGCNTMVPLNPPPSDPVRNMTEAVDKAMRFIADNRERLIRAWLAETGCLPSESLLVEQRHSEKDGVVKMTVHVERRPAPDAEVPPGPVPVEGPSSSMTLSEARLTLLDPKDNPVMNGRYVIGVDRRGRAICFAPEVTGDTLREVFDEARKLEAKGPITVYGYTSLIAETATYRFRQLAAPSAAPASEPRPGGGIRATVPASEPAVRPLSVPQEAIDREVAECRAMERKFPVSRHDNTAVVVALADRLDTARAEVEQLRGKLAEAERLSDSWRRAAIRATARVRSMRDAAANGTT